MAQTFEGNIDYFLFCCMLSDGRIFRKLALRSHTHWCYVINLAFSNDLWSVASERRIRVCLDSSRQTCSTDSWLWGHVWSHLCVHEKVDLCCLYYTEFGNEWGWVYYTTALQIKLFLFESNWYIFFSCLFCSLHILINTEYTGCVCKDCCGNLTTDLAITVCEVVIVSVTCPLAVSQFASLWMDHCRCVVSVPYAGSHVSIQQYEDV